MNYPSKLVEKAVEEISKLPGIGKKTAFRLAMHLLKQPSEGVKALSVALTELREKTTYCKSCHCISDADLCGICTSHRRQANTICVVEDTRDVIAIENTSSYTGLYHVLGGIINPIEGIGPGQLNIETLTQRLHQNTIKEVIFALPATLEADTTTYYLRKKIKEASPNTQISSIARGIPVGGELEFTDEVTLGRSIATRTFDS